MGQNGLRKNIEHGGEILMKTFCYFIVIFSILLNCVGLKLKTKTSKTNPPLFFLILVQNSIVIFSCIIVALDLLYKIINY